MFSHKCCVHMQKTACVHVIGVVFIRKKKQKKTAQVYVIGVVFRCEIQQPVYFKEELYFVDTQPFCIRLFHSPFTANLYHLEAVNYNGPNGSLFIPYYYTIPNSEFRIPNSEIRRTNWTLAFTIYFNSANL